MGILLEADYKGVITGKVSPWSGLSRAFSARKGGSQNPLERKEGEALEPQERDGQLTYELMNRDSGRDMLVERDESLILTGFTQQSPSPKRLRPTMYPPSSSSPLRQELRCCPNDISLPKEMPSPR